MKNYCNTVVKPENLWYIINRGFYSDLGIKSTYIHYIVNHFRFFCNDIFELYFTQMKISLF